MAALKAAHKHGIKKVVVTSSVAAISTAMVPFPDPITEECWSDQSKMAIDDKEFAYANSKTLAEKAAWEFHKSLPESERFDLVTICPGIVFGRNLYL